MPRQTRFKFKKYAGRSGKYIIQFQYRKMRQSKVVQTKSEGVAWARAAMNAIDLKLDEKKGATLMFSEAVRTYCTECLKVGHGKQNVDEKFRAYDRFADFLEITEGSRDIALEAVDREFVLFFRQHVADCLGPKSGNRTVKWMNALWNRFGHVVPKNPWKRLKKLKEPQYRRQVPTSEEVAAILQVTEPWEWRLLFMYLHSGARPGEIRRLELSDVHFERNGFEVWTRKRKDGEKHYRFMPMSGTVRKILKEQVVEAEEAGAEHVFFNPNTLGRWKRNQEAMVSFLPSLCERAGLENRYTLYALRHFVSHEMLRTDRPLKEIQNQLGHMNLSTTETYLRTTHPEFYADGGFFDEMIPGGSGNEVATGQRKRVIEFKKKSR